jgi:hypothetical protein
MQRIQLLFPLAALVATITLGLSWATGIVPPKGTPQCNCIDGFTGREGVFGWDPIQQRYKCVTSGCYVITE